MLTILYLEDNPLDIELVRAQLEQNGLTAAIRPVTKRESYIRELNTSRFDCILIDYSIPGYSGPLALDDTLRRTPDTPAIMLSGVMGEEQAIECLHMGATDYVLKQRIERLTPAVQRALRESRERQRRREAEQALRESEERYREFIAFASEGVYRLDCTPPIDLSLPRKEFVRAIARQTSMAECNQAFADFHDYPPPETLQGRRMIDLLPRSCCRMLIGVTLRLIESNFRISGWEFSCVDHSGRTRSLSTSIFGAVQHNRLMRLWGVQTDITDRKRMEELLRNQQGRLEESNRQLNAKIHELDEANRKLRQLDELKSEFVSMASHELRTPLTAIRGFSDTLLDESVEIDTYERRTALQIMRSEALRLSTLLNELLDLSRIEKGALETHFTNVNLGRLIYDTIHSLKLSRAPRLNIDTEQPIVVNGDPNRLKQVLINVLDNAVRHTPETGTISVIVAPDRHRVRVTIRNTGVCIPPDELPKIFDKFYRCKEERSVQSAGSGLGLSIAKEIIDKHRGSIWAESAPETGTSVSFTLPLAAGKPEKAAVA